MRWTRRPTAIDGEIIPDDWVVLCNGNEVGRVYYAVNQPPPRSWAWGSWAATCRSGGAESLDDALDRVREAVLASSGVVLGGKHAGKRLW